MIPGKSSDRTITGNIEGEQVVMGLDEYSLSHIMDMLINVYNDPEMAVLREYSVNARDSQIEAGVTRPIEVTLPNALSPFLKIKDYGLGLGRLDIINVYSKYGASTKRESNEVTGSLGIGSKSALTYTGQFTVVGVKNQLRTMITVSRDEEDGGTMTIMEESETTEPNGVEIIIPVKPGNSLEQKAHDLFQYWEKGTVLVNGEEPKRVEGLMITDQIMLIEKEGYYDIDNVLVMGGVPYDIPSEVNPFKSKKFRLVAFVKMGDVSFPASREALTLTRKTRERLELLGKEIRTALQSKVSQDIDAAPTATEGATVYLRWRLALEGTEMAPEALVYKAKEFPARLSFPVEHRKEQKKSLKNELLTDPNGDPIMREYDYQRTFIVAPVGSDKVGQSYKHTEISLGEYLRCVQVTGFDLQDFSAPHKRKLEKYCAMKGLDLPDSFLLTKDDDGPLDTEWIDPERLIEWVDVKDIKLDRKAPVRTVGPKRLTGSYDVFDSSGYARETKAENLPTDKPIYYMGPRQFTNGAHPNSYMFKDRSKEAVQRLNEEHPCTVVSLGLNRWDKFKRDFPEAKEAKEALIEIYNRLVKGVTERQMEAHRLREDESGSLLAKLDDTQVNDPELARLIRLASSDVPARIQRIKAFSENGNRNVLSWIRPRDESFENVTTLQPPLLRKRYPLLLSLNQSNIRQADTYFYLNAAYQAKKGQ